jgi:hypothetical protein
MLDASSVWGHLRVGTVHCASCLCSCELETCPLSDYEVRSRICQGHTRVAIEMMSHFTCRWPMHVLDIGANKVGQENTANRMRRSLSLSYVTAKDELGFCYYFQG